jgi:hypothetical protein
MTLEEAQKLAVEAARTPESRLRQKKALSDIQHQKGERNSQFGSRWMCLPGESRVKVQMKDVDHYLAQGYVFSKVLTPIKPKISLEELLVGNSPVRTGTLKKRLLKEGLMDNVCVECGQPPVWCGKPLIMVLDHINGNPTDNRLENLRLLCSNCNSQTDTFCGRNKRPNEVLKNFCGGCGLRIQLGSKNCGSCASKRRQQKMATLKQSV